MEWLDQASDQGGSQNGIALQEMGSPWCFGFPLGPVLPRCVRVTTRGKERLMERRRVDYAQKKGHFRQRDDGFGCVGSPGTLHEDLCGVSGTTALPEGPKTLKKSEALA